MNDKKKRKRKHEGDSSSTDSEDERKSRKTPKKDSETQQINEERRKKESRHGRLKNVEISSTSDSSSKSSDAYESDHARKKKKRKEKDKAKKRKEKRKRKREKKEKKRKRRKAREDEKAAVESIEKGISTNTDRTQVETSRDPQLVSEAVSKKRPMVPMTKEEYEKQQAQVTRVYDPETGRHRLVKGTGEILEEIVSRDRHKAINKTATQGDGAFFQANLGLKDR